MAQAFRFYDVITALSNGTPPLSAAPTPGCLQPLPPLGAPSLSPLCNVDTLLGMATTLWPIIHRLAGLRALKTELETALHTNQTPSKVAVLRTEFESTAQAIESALLQWQPQLPPNFIPDDDDSLDTGINEDIDIDIDTDPTPTDPSTEPITTNSPPTDDNTPQPQPQTQQQQQQQQPPSPHPSPDQSRISSIHHNALAYRHASLVYLYRTVLSRARTHASVQTHARLALRHCVATVRNRGPMSALLWPLFVSACEAATPEDRALADRAFVEVDRRQGMRNIERARGILGEVWRREDEAAEVRGEGGLDGEEGGFVVVEGVVVGGEEMWRKVCREMGVSIVFG
jgi:hypothetical protein